MSLPVFLADGQAVVRNGLKLWLETQADLHVVGEATERQGGYFPLN
jgi:DNA-binding NarL/FixJ family response regulator